MIKIVSDKAPKVDIQSILTAEEITAIHEFMHHYPHARAASLDALKVVQKRNGWVDDAQVNAVANMLDVPVTDIEGVATFFNRIYRSPVGRHVILICDSVACYLTGYEALSAELQKQLGIGYGQTTPDGRFTILPICCLGNCDKGPAVLINEDTYGPVTPAEVTQLLELYP